MPTASHTPVVRLNTALLRARVPNIRRAAASVGLRSATISDLLTGRKSIERAEVRTLVALAELARCAPDDLLVREPASRETFAASIARWAIAGRADSASLGEPHVTDPLSEAEGLVLLKLLPRAEVSEAGNVTPAGPYAL